MRHTLVWTGFGRCSVLLRAIPKHANFKMNLQSRLSSLLLLLLLCLALYSTDPPTEIHRTGAWWQQASEKVASYYGQGTNLKNQLSTLCQRLHKVNYIFSESSRRDLSNCVIFFSFSLFASQLSF